MKLFSCLSWTFLSCTTLLMATTSNATAQATRSRSTTQITAADSPASSRKTESSPTVSPVPSGRENTQQNNDPGTRRNPAKTQSKSTSESRTTTHSAANAKVYDRQGQLLRGYKQVGPNRVLDTRTGRYHDTAQMGDGQRLLD